MNKLDIILVDEHDNEIGFGEKMAVHCQGQLHRAFSIVVIRRKGDKTEVLLQQRSANKYHSANLWTNTCCGHPRPEESIIEAGVRRLNEEMGFGVELKEIGSFHYNASFLGIGLSENEIDHILIGSCDRDEFSVNPEEVQDYKWVDFATLGDEVKQNPQKFTIWLPKVIEYGMNYV